MQILHLLIDSLYYQNDSSTQGRNARNTTKLHISKGLLHQWYTKRAIITGTTVKEHTAPFLQDTVRTAESVEVRAGPSPVFASRQHKISLEHNGLVKMAAKHS